ncbi:4-hydroxymandelate oxidase [Sporomusa carbonis]|uniref:alpha-hydroxy-acid oxidizing protein n=1 Tax=Sporomusa carbonis TaxID=3076075 RepID=UPI003A67AAD4
MDLLTLKAEARKKLAGYCRVCPICNGKSCAGEVPGMGGIGTGSSFAENITALSSVKLNLTAIHDASTPDTATLVFGQYISTPIMAAPMVNSRMNTGGGLTEKELAEAITAGTHQAGSLTWLGDPIDTNYEWFNAMQAAGRGVVIVKPRVNHDHIIEAFVRAEQFGAVAVGIDVDGAGLITMKLRGQAVGPKTKQQIAELAKSTKLPFVVKGIMNVADAVKCAEAGAAGIVISNHGGRVLDYTCGTASVVPGVARELKGRIEIFVDGGVRSGVDALKMLALGADGVLVGRPLIIGAYGGGAAGVRYLFDKYTEELGSGMILTGCNTIKQIDSGILINS